MREGGNRTAARLAAMAYRYRAGLLCAVIFGVMSASAPNFLTAGNFRGILKAASVNLPAAMGFTIVLICGQLDLSVGSVMTMGGMAVVALQPELGWAGSLTVALALGATAGAINGLLVAKLKINSFIVTLGMMIIVKNAILMVDDGTIPAETYELSDFLQMSLGVVTPEILVTFALMGALAVFLKGTPVGKGFYLMGGNAETAWYSGLRVDRYTIGAFVLSGLLSALGGAVVAMSEAVASPTLGDSSLMVIVAAVIIGGTSMEGGKGGVVGTAVALVALAALINGLSCRGAGYEIQLMASGLVLASVILYDAWTLHRREKRRGQRPDLLKELRMSGGDAPPA